MKIHIETQDLLNMIEQWRDGNLSRTEKDKIAIEVGNYCCQWEIDSLIKAIIVIEERTGAYYRRGTLVDRLRYVLEQYGNRARKADQKCEKQMSEVLVEFRTLIAMSNAVGMGGTHSEKDARLRGLIDYLGSRISEMENHYGDYLCGFSDSQDWHFRSLYPVRRLLERLKEQEYEIKQLYEKVGEMPPDEQRDDDLFDWDIPF